MNDLRSIVGDCPEWVYPFREKVCLICNSGGRRSGLKYNRALPEFSVDAIIAGTIIVCGIDQEGSNQSLSDDQVRRYKKRFWSRETFLEIGNEVWHVKNPPSRHEIKWVKQKEKALKKLERGRYVNLV